MRNHDLEVAKELLDVVPGVMMSIREQMRCLASGKFTVPQFRILNRLLKRPQTARELAAWMGVSAPTMSKMVEALEDRDMICRRCDPEDRRAHVLTLTVLGRREAEKIRHDAVERFAGRLSRLTTDETHALSHSFELLTRLFDDKKPSVTTERSKPVMKLKTGLHVLMILMAIGFSSCVGDKSQDDYFNERSAEARANILAVSGTYRGTLRSDGGATLGAFSVEINEDSAAVNKSDNTSQTLQTTIKGEMSFVGPTEASLRSDAGSYDNGAVKLSAGVYEDSGKLEGVITLDGQIKNGHLTGTVSSQQTSTFTGSFDLIKDGPSGTGQYLSTGRTADIGMKSQKFVTVPTADSKGNADDVLRMEIQYKEKSSEEFFLGLLSSQRRVNVRVDGDSLQTPMSFADVVLDERNGTLIGDTEGKGQIVQLYCKRQMSAATAIWACLINGIAVNFASETSGKTKS